jgi:hypothetical protein
VYKEKIGDSKVFDKFSSVDWLFNDCVTRGGHRISNVVSCSFVPVGCHMEFLEHELQKLIFCNTLLKYWLLLDRLHTRLLDSPSAH